MTGFLSVSRFYNVILMGDGYKMAARREGDSAANGTVKKKCPTEDPADTFSPSLLSPSRGGERIIGFSWEYFSRINEAEKKNKREGKQAKKELGPSQRWIHSVPQTYRYQ